MCFFPTPHTGMSENVPRPGPDWQVPHRVRGAVSLAAQCQEELPQRHLPQLATRIQCGADDVCHYHGELWPCSAALKYGLVLLYDLVVFIF